MERKGHAGARSAEARKGKEQGGVSDWLESILDRDNLNRLASSMVLDNCNEMLQQADDRVKMRT